jgi:hypothetical protein
MSERTIPAACQVDGDRRGSCNLRMSKARDEITLDPHVTGSCVISLDESGALKMRNTLTEWLATWTNPSVSSDLPWSATRRTIPATCHTHRGCRGFCNLRVSRAHDEIMLDPHVTGSSVISLNEDGALAVRDTLTEFLGA